MEPDLSWLVPIKVMLGSLNHGEVWACSISSVAVTDKLRDRVSKEEAYKPKIISIGLLNRGGSTTRQLQSMEELKWNYMRDFLNRQGTKPLDERINDSGSELLRLDKVIRASYGGNIESEPTEIAKIMILDGCFLLELLKRLENYMEGNQTNESHILMPREKILLVVNDITKLENQIPLIVLKKLYRKSFPVSTEIKDDHRVANMVCKAFGYPLMGSSGGAHILQLIHLSTVEQHCPHQQKAKQELLRCATKLLAAGITFLSNPNGPSQSQSQNQHNLADSFTFHISFENGELGIPTLYVKETTEVKWRNLIAWEQQSRSRTDIQCKYTSYALFFKSLICSKHDIELLLEKRIIVNEANKSMEDLLSLFEKISTGVELMDSSYSDICKKLNEYKEKRVTRMLQKFYIITWHQCRRVIEMVVRIWGNWYRILIREHIPTVWKFIAIISAALLLVLTMMQTYYASKNNDRAQH